MPLSQVVYAIGVSFALSLLFGLGSVEAATTNLQVVDKNCYVDVFDDSKFDADDPHVRIQGPTELPSMKNLQGRNWSNDIQSVIIGPNATVRAYKEADFKGTELAFLPSQQVPDLDKLDMGNEIESMKVMCNEQR